MRFVDQFKDFFDFIQSYLIRIILALSSDCCFLLHIHNVCFVFQIGLILLSFSSNYLHAWKHLQQLDILQTRGKQRITSSIEMINSQFSNVAAWKRRLSVWNFA